MKFLIAIILLSTLSASAQLKFSPVASWPMEESTRAEDVSGNGNSANYSNAMTVGAGIIGNAIIGNGTNNYIRIPNSSSLVFTGGLTIVVWVNELATNSLFGIATRWQCGSNTGTEFQLFINAGTLNLTLLSTTNSAATFDIKAPAFYNLKPNVWTHVGCSVTPTSAALYINGLPVVVTNLPNATYLPANRLMPVIIGARSCSGFPYTPSDMFFNGRIDSLEMWNFGLSAAQIGLLFNRSHPPENIK